MNDQKIVKKSSAWSKHGHPVATRGEYQRIIREQELQKRRKKRRQWFQSLSDLWDSIRHR
jgi:hypothetical protein